MRHGLRLHLFAAAVFVAVCLLSAASFADSQSASSSTGCTGTCNYNGYSFAGTLNNLGSGNYSVSFTVTNNNSNTAENSFVQDWSLTLFSPGTGNNTTLSNLTNFTVSQDASDYTAIVGKANNGGTCHSTSDTSVCVSQTSGSPALLGPGQSITFSMDFTCSGDCSELANWILLAGGSACNNIGNGNCFAVSTDTVETPAVPEPSSLVFFGSGLVALGAAVRRRVGRNRPMPIRQPELAS